MPKLRVPKGYITYKGAGKSFEPSADGTHWFAQCADGPLGFGMYVFRQRAIGIEPAEVMPYAAPLMQNRGELVLGGDGVLYVTGGTSDSDAIARAEPLAGFVPYVRGTAVQPPAPPAPSTTDTVARAAIAALQTRVVALEQGTQRLASRVQTTESAIADIRATLKVVYDVMWQNALDAAYLFAKQRGLIKE